ncbi:zinc finger protein 865 [Drosophila kikkawai]|uniref:Zinc finger protein 865 n=1 Tax=Drosophila kikkawai TaxID=30033 RepID=A0A6P4JP13_DROKI|nr:zinc finger protein 628 [Drosophila kikkawai]
MICRLCLNALDEQNAVLLFGGAGAGSAPAEADDSQDDGASGKAMPESYLVQLISIHLYLCLSRDDAISTCICTECCAQLESFHNFWKLVELKQTTLCSQFLEIDCDVNWSEDGGGGEPDAQLEPHTAHLILEPEFPEIWVKTEPKAAVTTPTTANKFPCMFCEKSFKMRRYLEEHIATHTGDRPIACPYCEMAFRCRSNMYTHVKSKHTTQWLKAREERDAARSQNQGAVLGGEVKLEPAEEPAPMTAPAPVPAPSAVSVSLVPASTPAPVTKAPQPSPPSIQQQPLPLSVIKSEPGEAINLTMTKAPPSSASRVSRTRSSRRKTHSPKKVQHTEGSDASDEDLPQKRLKENELILANYNAVAAAVVAAAAASTLTGGSASVQPDSLQQRLCASLLQQQQQQDQLFAVMSATAAAAAVVSSHGAATTTTTTTTTGSILGDPYSSPPAEADRRALDKRRHNPPPPPTTTSIQAAAPISLICPNCGELPGQNHRCLSKPKYACDVCGKCFKMKRYLEEHFATHTGVKLHTCAFCPTEFRSKSNMYHHTKRKHKAEWERSRATRSAAKAGAQEQQQPQQEQQLPSVCQGGPAAV